jgi:MoaA/NifB/PqqE/SkfB family radical SAM enzyme
MNTQNIKKHITNSNPETCTVTWEITNKCNYSCWYCPDELHSGSNKWPNIEDALAFIIQLSSNHKYVHLDLIGGEPTLWPQLSEFLQKLPTTCSVELTTNGSRSLRWWTENLKYLSAVTISAHLSFKYFSEEHIINVCTLLQGKVNLTVLILFSPTERDRIIKLHQRLVQMNVTNNVNPIWPKFGEKMIDYSDTDRQLLRSCNFATSNAVSTRVVKPHAMFLNGTKVNRRDLIINNENVFFNWQCLAGVKRFHIASNGNVYAGSCRSKLLGSIYSLSLIEFPNSSITCKKLVCICSDDIKTEKWLNE